MTSPLRVLVPLLLLGASSLAGQVSSAWSGCKSDSLSTYNCAQYYSGTVSISSELKGADFHQTFSATATITAGRVSCHVKGSEVGEFTGAGMIGVDHGNTMNGGEYAINVWCPSAEGERLTRGDSPLIQVMDQQVADYATLDGKDAHEAPDADAANGVSGTETITWHLTRAR